MHPLDAHHLYDLAAGAHAAAFAVQNEDDVEQRYGLIAAVEQLTAQLMRITGDMAEKANFAEAQPRAYSIAITSDEDETLQKAAAAAKKTPSELATEIISQQLRRAAQNVANPQARESTHG
ncbi:MAG: hypothetical protein ACLFS2_12985 [Halochromatium sp.]|uniref:hypothetical protein n=1 Tax=Halochromatium sp. TaxID=2049430 RepID=UPI003979E670